MGRLTNPFHLLHKTILLQLEEVAVLANAQKHREARRMKKQKNMFQTNKQKDKHLETDLNRMKTRDRADKEFKLMVIKMLRS